MRVSQRVNWLALLVVLVAAFSILPALSGQDAQVDDAAVPVEDAPVGDADVPAAAGDSLLQMILDSGVTGVAFMGVLGLFSLVAATVTLERAVNMRRGSLLPHHFVDELSALVRKDERNANAFAALCDSCKAPISTIVRAGVLRCGHPLLEVEKAMEDAAAREMAELRAKIRPLKTVGTVAPLIGLLGTVVGMIIAFHTASQAGLGKAELLAKGIYMALLTTAGGLSVAIPALMLGSYFTGRVEKFFREMDKHLIPVIPCLARSSGEHTSDAAEVTSSKSTSQKNKLMSV